MRDSIDVVAVSIHNKEATSEYIRTNGLKVNAFIPQDSSFYKIYRPVAVPQTIIVSPELKVLKNYAGVLTSGSADSAATFLSRNNSQSNQ